MIPRHWNKNFVYFRVISSVKLLLTTFERARTSHLLEGLCCLWVCTSGKCSALPLKTKVAIFHWRRPSFEHRHNNLNSYSDGQQAWKSQAALLSDCTAKVGTFSTLHNTHLQWFCVIIGSYDSEITSFDEWKTLYSAILTTAYCRNGVLVLQIALLFIILMMNYFCERVAVSVCRTMNCLFCEDFLPSAYLLLCDLGSGAYLLLCDVLLEARKCCLWKRKFRSL